MKNRMCKWQCCVSESDFEMRIRIQLLKHWRQKPKLSAMFSETITCKWYKYPQLILKYTLGVTGSLRYFRIITERSLILVFCSTLFAKFMDPDPHRDFLPGSGSAKNKRSSVTLGKGQNMREDRKVKATQSKYRHIKGSKKNGSRVGEGGMRRLCKNIKHKTVFT